MDSSLLFLTWILLCLLRASVPRTRSKGIGSAVPGVYICPTNLRCEDEADSVCAPGVSSVANATPVSDTTRFSQGLEEGPDSGFFSGIDDVKESCVVKWVRNHVTKHSTVDFRSEPAISPSDAINLPVFGSTHRLLQERQSPEG